MRPDICCGVSPVYVVVPPEALDIRDQAVQSTRRRNPLDQLDEAGWMVLARALVLLLGAGVALAILALPCERWLLRLMAAPLTGPIVFVVAALASFAYVVAT